VISFNDIIDKNIVKHPPKSKIIGIGGSPRKGGNSDVLLKNTLQNIENTKVTSQIAHLRELQFQPCIGCEKCRKNKICTGLIDGMSLLYPKIIEAKGLVLVSPTHNYNITAIMKAFIDRLYCFYNFDNKNRPGKWSSQLENQGRKAIIIAVCEQNNKKDMGFTLEAMRLPLEALGYEIVEELAVFGVFSKGKIKENTEILAKCSMLGKKLAEFIVQ
jgi:multimeric flavodoxin WrbA